MKKRIKKHRNRKLNFEDALQFDWVNNAGQIINKISKKMTESEITHVDFFDYFKKKSEFSFDRKLFIVDQLIVLFSYEELVLFIEELNHESFFEKTKTNFFSILNRVFVIFSSSTVILTIFSFLGAKDLEVDESNINEILGLWHKLFSSNPFLYIVFISVAIVGGEILLLTTHEGWKMQRKRKKLMVILSTAVKKLEYEGID